MFQVHDTKIGMQNHERVKGASYYFETVVSAK